MSDAVVLVRPYTSDVNVARSVFLQRCFEHPCAVAPSVILDLGAYTGLSTRFFCDAYPDATVIAVEPHPAHVALLRQNAPRAEVVEAAVGAESGRATLRGHPKGHWAAHTRAGGVEIAAVDVVTVDEILDGRRAALVKMDIEGAEREVLRAGGDWLYWVRLLFIEVHERFAPGAASTLRSALDRTGRPYAIHGGGSDKVVELGEVR